MKIIDMLPQLDAAALATVHANALRLVSGGTDKQKAEAGAALPLIEAERAKRVGEAGPKTVRAKPKPKPKLAAKAKRRTVQTETEEEAEAEADLDEVEELR